MHDVAVVGQDAASLAPLIDGDVLAGELDEPLRESARLMFELAHKHCAGVGDADDCRMYHATWQYLRLCGVRRGVRIDGPLFVAAVERLARAGRLSRVLISCAADYSMLAHVAHGARRGGAEPIFDVVDRCETALGMNSWYGAQRGLEVNTYCSSILAFQPKYRYDLICTHSLLEFLPIQDRPVMIQRWSEWLEVGGKLCFSNVVSELPSPADLDGRSRRVAALMVPTIERLKSIGMPLPCDRATFETMIYGAGLSRAEDAPAMPLQLVRRWIEDAGMKVEVAGPVTSLIPGEADRPMLATRGPERHRAWFQAARQ